MNWMMRNFYYMPLYDVKCDICAKHDEIYRAVKDYDDLPQCCGEKMHRMLSAPYVVADIQPYQSMVTGEMITSRSQHRNHLKEHRMIEIGNEVQKPRQIDKKAEKAKRIEAIKKQIHTAR